MLKEVIFNKNFEDIMINHMKDLITYLFEKDSHFGVVCNVDDINFNPELPNSIKESMQDMTLFFLAGYTYETAVIQDNSLKFEAGFGNDNFGSIVTIPLINIMQIIVDETPIFLNQIASFLNEYKMLEQTKEEDYEQGMQNSMEMLLSNPENEHLFKKKT